MANAKLLRVNPTKGTSNHNSNSNDSLNIDVFVKRPPIKPLSSTANGDHDYIVNSAVRPNSAVADKDAWQEVVLQSHLSKSLVKLNRSRDVLDNYPLSEDEKKISKSQRLRL